MENIIGVIQDLLTNDAVQQGIIYLVGLLVAWALRSKAVQKRNLGKLIEAANIAVTETYRDYVRNIKLGKEDGKLSEYERQTARDSAMQVMKNILAEQGIGLAKSYGPRLAEYLIEKAVARSKTGGRVAAAALAPFSMPGLPSGFDS